VSGVPTGPWGWCLALLMVGLIAGCSGGAQPRSQDATVVDRASTKDQTTIDHAADDDVPTGPDVSFDASVDLGLDATVDVAVDAAVDVALDAVDVPDPWGDTPRVDLGGILVPVDPHAVPAPGSECTGDGGVRIGDPTIAPPRPIRPLSVSRVTSQRPTFQWVLPEGTTGARVEMCADRCCIRVLQTIDAEGTTVRPTTALPPGVVFWRMFGRRGTVVGSRASYTWEFGVRHRDAPNDTSWGTIRDFNGDGFDDLFVFRSPMDRDDAAELLIMPGSSEGLRAPVPTGVVSDTLMRRAELGDFNGDGKIDMAWESREGEPDRSWVRLTVVHGTAGEPRPRLLSPDIHSLGLCARLGSISAIDWNGDGYSDLAMTILLGCGFASPPQATLVFVCSGSPAGLAAVPQEVGRLDRFFPHPLVRIEKGAGDLDLDGRGDVIVSSSFSGSGTTSIPDEIVILLASPLETPRIEFVPQPLPRRGQWGFAESAPIGDVDGDGYIDIMISVGDLDGNYVYRHASGLRDPASTLSLPLPFPAAWSSSGDLNGDGLSDVIAAAEGAYEEVRDGFPYNRGRVYVFRGSPAGVSSATAIVATSRSPTDRTVYDFFGSQAMSPGDINGDGIDDLVAMDTFEQRLCTRFGSLDFSSGLPSGCANGITTNHVSISTYIF
jgi:hypothetical protein